MRKGTPWIWRVIRRAYPKHIRERYGPDLLDHYRDEYGAPESGALRFWTLVTVDALVQGAAARVDALGSPVRRGAAVAAVHLASAFSLRWPLRSLRRSPGFVFLSSATLGLGLGAAVVAFAVVHPLLFRELPHVDGRGLVVVSQTLGDGQRAGVSPVELTDYRNDTPTLERLVERHTMSFTLLDDARPVDVTTGVVSWDYFEVMGVEPVLGRLFTPADDRHEAEPVLLLSHDFWVEQLRRDPRVLGKALEMNDRPHTVVGILPPVPDPRGHDVWMPVTACPFRSMGNWRESRSGRGLTILARRNPGVSLAEVEADLGRAAGAMARTHPDEYPGSTGLGASAEPLRDALTAGARPTLILLSGMALLLLAAACSNVANVTLARLSFRERELSVCAAMGAGRGRIVAQVVAENVLVALVGLVVGLGLASVVLEPLAEFTGFFTVRAGEIGMDGWAMGFGLVVALFCGLVTGGGPALVRLGASTRAPETQRVDRTVRAGGRLRRGLVALQVGLAVVLLTGGGLMLRSFAQLSSVDPGFRSDGVWIADLDLDWTRYENDRDATLAFWRQLRQRVEGVPGVASATVARQAPLTCLTCQPSVIRMVIEDGHPEGGGLGWQVDVASVAPGFFETLGVPLLEGRDFAESDDAEAPGAVVLGRALARRLWGGESPLGATLRFEGSPDDWTVVGVADDVRRFGLTSDVPDQAWIALAQTHSAGARNLVVRASGPATDGVPDAILAQVAAVDPRQPVASVTPMAELERESVAPTRVLTAVLVVFAGLGLAVAVAGVLGLVAYTVSGKTREIGIRMALGVRGRSILWGVMRESLGLIAVGLAAGLLGATVFGRLLDGHLFQVDHTDPWTFAGVSLTLVSAAALAAYLPARRAVRVDPTRALREE